MEYSILSYSHHVLHWIRTHLFFCPVTDCRSWIHNNPGVSPLFSELYLKVYKGIFRPSFINSFLNLVNVTSPSSFRKEGNEPGEVTLLATAGRQRAGSRDWRADTLTSSAVCVLLYESLDQHVMIQM